MNSVHTAVSHSAPTEVLLAVLGAHQTPTSLGYIREPEASCTMYLFRPRVGDSGSSESSGGSFLAQTAGQAAPTQKQKKAKKAKVSLQSFWVSHIPSPHRQTRWTLVHPL